MKLKILFLVTVSFLFSVSLLADENKIDNNTEFNVYTGMFVFTDVDCGYCRQFHDQIDSYLELGIKVNGIR